LFRTNARICAFISFLVVPFVGAWSWRYVTVLRPASEAAKQKETEELLAEGKATA